MRCFVLLPNEPAPCYHRGRFSEAPIQPERAVTLDLSKLRRVQDAVVLTFPESRAEESRRAFNDLLREIIREGLHPKVVIDLGEVTWFSSLDLGGLVFALGECKERGLQFALACVGPRVRRVLEATKMDQVFSIHDTVESAVTA